VGPTGQRTFVPLTNYVTKTGVVPEENQMTDPFRNVYSETGYVHKDGQMTGAGYYTYATETAFIAALRPAMIEHGITVHVEQYELLYHETYTTTKGANMNRVVLLATVVFTDADGNRRVTQSIGEGSDAGDKAANKAMTGALKYALRQTFLIETGDDPDHQSSGEQERATMATLRKVAATKAPAKAAAAAPAKVAPPPPAPSGNGASWPVGFAEMDDDGDWHINCGDCHSIKKARLWPTNDKGASNVSCSTKKGDKWCKFRSTVGEIDALWAQVHGSPPAWTTALQLALAQLGLTKDDLRLLPTAGYGIKTLRDYMATDLGSDDPETGVLALATHVAELKGTQAGIPAVEEDVAELLIGDDDVPPLDEE
jgi:hypothetical protein